MLKYAKYEAIHHDGDRIIGQNNHHEIDKVYHNVQSSNSFAPKVSLGVGLEARNTPMTPAETNMLREATEILKLIVSPLTYGLGSKVITESKLIISPFAFDMGIPHTLPDVVEIHRAWKKETIAQRTNFGDTVLNPSYALTLNVYPRFTKQSCKKLYHDMKGIHLNHPFQIGVKCTPNTPEWFTAFAFYGELYNRYGIPIEYFEEDPMDHAVNHIAAADDCNNYFSNLKLRSKLPQRGKIDITSQFLSRYGGIGSVNHHFGIVLPDNSEFFALDPLNQMNYVDNNPVVHMAKNVILTWEYLHKLVTEYMVDGIIKTGIEIIIEQAATRVLPHDFNLLVADYYGNNPVGVVYDGILAINLTVFANHLPLCINHHLAAYQPADPTTTPAQYMAMYNINTWPMELSSTNNWLHPKNEQYAHTGRKYGHLLDDSFGHINKNFLRALAGEPLFHHNWKQGRYLNSGRPVVATNRSYLLFWEIIRTRIFADLTMEQSDLSSNDVSYMATIPIGIRQNAFGLLNTSQEEIDNRALGDVVSYVADNGLNRLHIDMNAIYGVERAPPAVIETKPPPRIEDVEIVIVRPNIEHCMLGIIMGLSGNELGNTLWGQTELSVYDDSMHGIW